MGDAIPPVAVTVASRVGGVRAALSGQTLHWALQVDDRRQNKQKLRPQETGKYTFAASLISGHTSDNLTGAEDSYLVAPSHSRGRQLPETAGLDRDIVWNISVSVGMCRS